MGLIKQMLLTERSSVSPKAERKPPGSISDHLNHRAAIMTSPLKNFEGYSHGGIND